jgi:hypothetical protein
MQGAKQKKGWLKKFADRLAKTSPCQPYDRNRRYPMANGIKKKV